MTGASGEQRASSHVTSSDLPLPITKALSLPFLCTEELKLHQDPGDVKSLGVTYQTLRGSFCTFRIMNLALLDPFILAQDFPDTLSGSLRSGHACSLRFNRRGDYLAAGRVDGTVVIWDMDTYGVARKLRGHTRSVQSLSWSRDGRYLLSASQDWKCILWDLKDGSRAREVKFEAPVFIADLHPYNPYVSILSDCNVKPD